MSALHASEMKKAVAAAIREIAEKDVVQRIWAQDHTVWSPEPTEITNRLGWLKSPIVMMSKIVEINRFADDVRNAGYSHVLLLGMGGSSLAPEVFRFTFGVKAGYLDLSVLDSTDPGVVLSYARKLDPAKTLFIVSTKSGGTVETASFFKYFYNLTLEKVGKEQAGDHFVAITDPGSALEQTAAELKFRKTFLNDANIGGRYSVLSYFGLVPASLLGVDIRELLQRAQAMAEQCKNPNVEENPGAHLGAVMGQLAAECRDKLTLLMPKAISSFGGWIEQLVAESTGKDGKGILPVDLEVPGKPDVYGDDRFFVYSKHGSLPDLDETVSGLQTAGHPVFQLEMADEYDLGAEFFRWEFATAVACERLQINPFDQPDVESAKVVAREMMSAFSAKGKLPSAIPALVSGEIEIYGNINGRELPEVLQNFFDQGTNNSVNGYVAIQAYLPGVPAVNTALEHLRHTLRDRYKLPVTLGYGPRFLHSTGQLHKGDAGNGLFVQITADSIEDAEIPSEPGSSTSEFSFGVLKSAQAMGDRQALLDKNRKVIRLHLQGELVAGVKRIAECPAG